MPLSTDEKLLALSRNVIEAFDKADGGVHPGFRPVHAKGILLTGAFTLSSEAASLTRAPHIQQNSTLVTVRLSDRQSRRICAQELLNGIRVRASSIGGDQRVKEFQEIFRSARGEGVDGMSDDVAMDVFVKMEADGATARARILSIVIGDGRNSCERLCRLLSRSRPVLRRSCSFAISAFKFTNAAGVSRYGRYRILPVAGNEYLDDAGAAGKTPNFLFDELKERVEKEPVKFRIVVQLAQDGDTVDDATIRWPEDRPQLTFGEISLTAIASDNASEQQRLIFDPIPRVDGIEASADPLFEPRANVYLLSGRRRRTAGE